MSENKFANMNEQIIHEFRESGGTVETGGFGRALVLLNHIGAKSGTPRTTPVVAIHSDDDTWLIAASKAGAPDNPDWYHNLLAHPDVTIETPDDGDVAVHVEELQGAARDEGWARFTAQSSGFADYEKKTDRLIPVLALRRREA